MPNKAKEFCNLFILPIILGLGKRKKRQASYPLKGRAGGCNLDCDLVPIIEEHGCLPEPGFLDDEEKSPLRKKA